MTIEIYSFENRQEIEKASNELKAVLRDRLGGTVGESLFGLIETYISVRLNNLNDYIMDIERRLNNLEDN